MRKNKLGMALLVGALLAVSLVACNDETLNQGNDNSNNNGNNNIVSDNNQNNENNEKENDNNDVIEPIESGEIYYFYDETFMGSLENGEWYSPIGLKDKNMKTKEWKCSDILSQEKYKMYNEFGQGEDKTSLTVYLGPEVGWFFGDIGMSEKTEEYNELRNNYNEALIEYGEEEDYDTVLKLPVKLDKKYDEITSNFTNSLFKFPEGMKKNIVMTNMKKELNFAKKATDVELSYKVLEYIAQYEKERNISEDLPYACWYKFDVDINKNGQMDEVYVISSNQSSDFAEDTLQVKEKGQFTMAIAVIDGKIVPILDSYISKNDLYADGMSGSYVRRIDVVDLDQDKEYEVCLIEGMLGRQYKYVFDYVDGEFKVVLCNYYGQ